MAEINVERKDASIWPWVLGLLLLGLLAWGVYELLDDDAPEVATAPAVVDAPVAPVAPVVDPAAPAVPPAPAVGTPGLAEILANPAAYAGQTWSTPQPVRAAEVVGDRSFWVESNGQRLFVIKNESPQPGVADVQGKADVRPARNVNAGEMLQMSGTLYTSVDQVQPPLDAQTRQVASSQPIFLVVNVADVQHM